MSKQSEAKKWQGYIESPEQKKCSTCRYYNFDTIKVNRWNGTTYEVKKGMRCLIGDFAVKANAICDMFEHRE